MTIQRQSQNVSLAHRPTAHGPGLGGNLRVELAVLTENSSPFMFAPYGERIKALLDHRCLFEEEPRFLARPSTLEAVASYVAETIFEVPPAGGEWSSLTVWELDRYGCTVMPGSATLRLTLRHRNLTLSVDGEVDFESQAALSRSEVLSHVDRVFSEFLALPGEQEFIWGQRLWASLSEGITGLQEVVVDLGSHRSMRLADGPSTLR